MAGVLLDKEIQIQEILLGDYLLTASHDYTWRWSSGNKEAESWPRAAGIVISIGPAEYVIAGSGVIFTFKPNSKGEPIAGIANIDEGNYVDGGWVPVDA